MTTTTTKTSKTKPATCALCGGDGDGGHCACERRDRCDRCGDFGAEPFVVDGYPDGMLLCDSCVCVPPHGEGGERIGHSYDRETLICHDCGHKRSQQSRGYDVPLETLAGAKPANAKAAIVAELILNASDLQADYWGHKTMRRVVLAWSAHKRNLFPELRKAATIFRPTMDLADGGDDFEHRDNYSFGAGMYLKREWIHHSGWLVRKLYSADDLERFDHAAGTVHTFHSERLGRVTVPCE